jgi:hypothetical protein
VVKTSYQLLHSKLHNSAGFILKIEVVDPAIKKPIFKATCDAKNKRDIDRIIEILTTKYDIPIQNIQEIKDDYWGSLD